VIFEEEGTVEESHFVYGIKLIGLASVYNIQGF
jgi:hypothetical protein